MRSAWVLVSAVALGCGTASSDPEASRASGAGGAEDAAGGQSGASGGLGAAGGEGPTLASFEVDDTPLDGIDSNGDGYDFPVMVSIEPLGTVAACPSLPDVALPVLVARSDCGGQPDLVIGWVSDCIKCGHDIDLVIGNRGTVPVDVAVNVTTNGNSDSVTGVSAGVGGTPRWWQAASSRGDYSLVGCTVAPGFEFGGFELAPEGWAPGRPAEA